MHVTISVAFIDTTNINTLAEYGPSKLIIINLICTEQQFTAALTSQTALKVVHL
jgi:hypothetical protein